MIVARCVRTVFAIAVAGGCTTSPVRYRNLGDPSRASAGIVVDAQELARAASGSLMDALQRLHPDMLVSTRGGTLLVSIDGSPPTDLSVLRTIPTSIVHEVRLQRSSSSVGQSGISPTGAVIVGDMLVVTTGGGARRTP